MPPPATTARKRGLGKALVVGQATALHPGQAGVFSLALLAGKNDSALPSGAGNPPRLGGIRPGPALVQLLEIAGFDAIFNIAN